MPDDKVDIMRNLDHPNIVHLQEVCSKRPGCVPSNILSSLTSWLKGG